MSTVYISIFQPMVIITIQLYNQPVTLEKQYYTLEMVIDVFTNQLENDVKAVGVNHHMDNNDETWDVTIWNPWAMHALAG